MSNIIEELKSEHIEIQKTFNSLYTLSTLKSEEAKKKIEQAKEILINHLVKEDEKIYPFLYKISRNDTNLKKTLEVFAKDAKEITDKAIKFFDKYLNTKNPSVLEFTRELGDLYASISRRIFKEENVIYKRFHLENHSIDLD